MTSTPPLYSQLYDALVDRIRSGVWKEGERLPTEQALVAEFGISRGPVRQALAQLRSEGLVFGTRGAPPRVQRAARSQSFETFISFTEWAEEIGRVPGQKVIEVTRRLADGDLARQLHVEEDSPVVAVVRLRLLDGEPVMIERGAYVPAAGRYLLAADLEVDGVYQTLRGHGIHPTRARNVIDAVAAGPLEARWLEVEVGSPLLRVCRTTFDQNGEIMDIAENKYLPNKATFAVENSVRSPTPLTRMSVDGGATTEGGGGTAIPAEWGSGS
ncbi:GntR family transcriptional regulator [Microbacterium capsulatum]|uniref:GntR family transcriptional regulator n=1 Tax=Microbacterium capsulatum TaxID=3041921 RepID=A0ABU0XDT3_9MICO|nr:GntR family transcriptional regulator [Microbacterium sp. ASV81]MDQ4213238.1 GntR family transcriptional regulator [Microbacterium sp. ASV81]